MNSFIIIANPNEIIFSNLFVVENEIQSHLEAAKPEPLIEEVVSKILLLIVLRY